MNNFIWFIYSESEVKNSIFEYISILVVPNLA
jgi:hypothetical protein